MVSLADSVSHRARFVWLGGALATTLAVAIAAHPAPASWASPHGCLMAPQPTQHAKHIYTGLMVGRSGETPYLHLMEDVLTSTLAKQRPAWIVESTLSGDETAGLSVSGTLDDLRAGSDIDYSNVTCRITLVLSTYPDRHVIEEATGSATVRIESSDNLEVAQQACVTTVVEDLTTNQLVPAID